MRAYISIPTLMCLFGCAVAQPVPAPTPSSNTPRVYAASVVSGARERIDFITSLNPDCTSPGYVTVRVITPPVHGELTTERGFDYSAYPTGNQRYQCNLKKSPVVNIYYKSSPGYVGSDTATIEQVSPIIAVARTSTYTITVR